MSCLITTRSAIKNTTRKQKQQQKTQQKFTAKTQYLNSKAPSNNVRLQSDKTLTTQTYFFLTTQQMRNNDTR